MSAAPVLHCAEPGKGGTAAWQHRSKREKAHQFLTVLVIAILIALVGVQLIHLRAQIESAQNQLTALKSDLDSAKQANDALASALEKADDPEFLQELARDQLGYVTPGEKSFYDVSN